jgi:hypothetical protein
MFDFEGITAWYNGQKGAHNSSQYSNLLQTGRSWVQTPVQAREILFSTSSTLTLVPIQPRLQQVLGPFPRGKVAKALHWLPTPI